MGKTTCSNFLVSLIKKSKNKFKANTGTGKNIETSLSNVSYKTLPESASLDCQS